MIQQPWQSGPQVPGLQIAYLINQYPKVSHSFIRREILALERRGVKVQRIAVRGWDAAVADEEDVVEKSQTQYVLEEGIASSALAAAKTIFQRPKAFIRAAHLALKLAKRGDRSMPFHLVYLAEACLVLEWIEKAGSTHLHAHFGSNPAEVALLVAALGGPTVSFTVHGPEEFDKPEALHLAEKIERASFVVAISSFGRSQLNRWIPYSQWSKVEVVHCGLEARFHEGAPRSACIASRLVCVGRLCEQKGQLLLLQAAAALLAEGLSFELVLAGDGELRSEIEHLIDVLRLHAHVRITGWISSTQVRKEILASRALVLPSFAEGLPVVIMEAMALSRPVISTYVAGIPELVEHEVSGWLCAAGDIVGLTASMRACLLTSNDVLETMGRAGHERVIARHDIDVEAAKLHKLFLRASRHEPVDLETT